MTSKAPLRLGTRGSELAVTQSQLVADAVTEATGVSVELVIISTKGDRIRMSHCRPLVAKVCLQLNWKLLFMMEA